MNVKDMNSALNLQGVQPKTLLPRLKLLERAKFVFDFSFGLSELPREPGIIFVRGARQLGKSTWLERELALTLTTYGPGSALYLNGDEVRDERELVQVLRELMPLFNPQSLIKRIFIDEITAIERWERGLKILVDSGELTDHLIVTTGSSALDLRRGTERLPGRKGRLTRTNFLFLPISYREFRRHCLDHLGPKECLLCYLLSGGSPLAANELVTQGAVPEYVIQLTRDWVLGACTAAGRQRSFLLAVLEILHRGGGAPLGYARLARDAGMANNTVAAGYVELLADLLCVAFAYAWDARHKRSLRRRPCKFHFVNLLFAVASSPRRLRSIAEFEALPPDEQGKWVEWLVAQEVWRRNAIAGKESPEEMFYWSARGGREIDFVLSPSHWLEVKRGQASPYEFGWIKQEFPGVELSVIASNPLPPGVAKSLTLEEFLLLDESTAPAPVR